MAVMEGGGTLLGRVCRGGRSEWRLYLLSIFSLAVAFVCLASALLVVVNLRAIQARWARTGHISVYLRDGAPEGDLPVLRRALDRTPGVLSTRYVSPSDARNDLALEPTNAPLATLPLEAFAASIELEIRPELTDEELASIANKLRALPSVDSVETYQRWTEKLGKLIGGGVAASALLALVVFSAVASAIGSTMRLALSRRRTEVEVLKLVGATDRFVRGPFVIEGALQGGLGAAISIALLAVLYLLVRVRFDDELGALLGAYPVFLPWPVALGLVSLGVALGAAAAFGGLRRISTV